MNGHADARLYHFPVALIAAVMGLTGLAIAFQKAHHFFGWQKLLFESTLLLSTAAFLAFIGLYALKAWRYPEAVKKEFDHPVKFNFFAAIAIALLLQSIAYYAYLPLLGMALWFPGTLLQGTMTLTAIRFWLLRPYEPGQLNPAWLIPIVGNILVPVVGVDLVPRELSLLFFSVGIFFWLVLSGILFHRLIFGPALADKFLPTLFILIAPPAVGFISYLRIAASFDIFAGMLLSLALFFLLVTATHLRQIRRLPFFVSWWAYTFPLDALAIALTLAAGLTGSPVYRLLAQGALGLALLAVVAVLTETVRRIERREICVEE